MQICQKIQDIYHLSYQKRKISQAASTFQQVGPIGVHMRAAGSTSFFIPAEGQAACTTPIFFLLLQPCLWPLLSQGIQIFDDIQVVNVPFVMLKLHELFTGKGGTHPAMSQALFLGAHPYCTGNAAPVHPLFLSPAPPAGEGLRVFPLTDSLLKHMPAFRKGRSVVITGTAVETTVSEQS
jgi:hypothetical protein